LVARAGRSKGSSLSSLTFFTTSVDESASYNESVIIKAESLSGEREQKEGRKERTIYCFALLSPAPGGDAGTRGRTNNPGWQEEIYIVRTIPPDKRFRLNAGREPLFKRDGEQ